VLLGKPLVFGAVFQFDGQATVFLPGNGPCYRCIFPEPPPPEAVPSCQEAGVFGVVPGIIGSIQAAEAIKLLLGLGRSLAGRLLIFDGLAMEFMDVKIERNPDCPVCGDHPTVTELIDYELFCGLRSHA
jgi:adenylyltransferase/sulfurtransferase